MHITRVGKRILPAVFALSAMTATANNINNNTTPISKNQTEISETPKENKGIGYNSLIFLMGAIGGAVGTCMTLGVVDKIHKRKSADNYFDKKFEKEGEKVSEYMGELIERAIGHRPYFVDLEEFMEETSKFTKRYPSRKEYLYAAVRVLGDSRLDDSQAELLCQHFALKAVSTEEEWKYSNIFPFLDKCETYEEAVNEFYINTVMAEEDAENDTEEEKIRAEEAKKEAQKGNKKKDDNESLDLSKNAITHNLKFSDVGGQKEAIKILKHNILYPIKYPNAFKNNNMNHGFVLYGAPGTGKTLLAEVLANESKAHFIKLNGTELASKWVGSSEENWRKVFEEAKEHQPSIIFIDEFDGVASKRGSGDIHGDKVLNQILGLLSGVEKNNDQIYIIATTNRLDKIDTALLRPGRLGTHIELKAPETEEEIEQILNIHLKKQPISDNFDKKRFNKQLLELKCTGADIAYIVNASFENAKERNEIYLKMENESFVDEDMKSVVINNEDFEKAIDSMLEERKTKNTPIGFKQKIG